MSLFVDYSIDPISVGMCTLPEAQVLFELYVCHLSPRLIQVGTDPGLASGHTWRCSFLLTVILHTAARHATSSLVPRAPTITRVLDRHLHSTLWPRVLVENKKNVHICQACMLWATLVSQPENGQENMGWTLFGHASESSCV
jgi:hypothetical protein